MNHASQISAVGIDVAKAMLSVCLRSPAGAERALVLRNIETDIKRKLIPLCQNYSGKIVMESTGHYHWLAALLLTEAGLDVRVVNPILAKQYTAGTIRKVKTDPHDASGLARMAHVADNLPPTFGLVPEKLKLRKKLGVISSSAHHLQGLRASLASLTEANRILGFDESSATALLRQSIVSLGRSLQHMEAEFVREVRSDVLAASHLSLIQTIPGVSPFSAALALHWFENLPGRNPKSWVAYAGLDISSRESGAWRGTCRLTKRGNAFLRRRLYSAAWGAVMNDAQMKTYYDSLRVQGRAHVEALIIIARKIVRTMFEVLRTGRAYDPALVPKRMPASVAIT